MEGGSPTVTTVTASAATATTRWLIPLRGEWFTRPANMPEADWTLSKAKLPGEISTSPNETYRLKLNPDTTTDAALEKLRPLAGLTGLEALDLTGCHLLTDAGLMHLGQLRGLKALSLTDTKVSDSGLTLLLTRFPTIEALGLGGAGNLTRSSIRYLKNLRNLKALALPPAADTGDVRREFAKIRPACNLA